MMEGNTLTRQMMDEMKASFACLVNTLQTTTAKQNEDINLLAGKIDSIETTVKEMKETLEKTHHPYFEEHAVVSGETHSEASKTIVSQLGETVLKKLEDVCTRHTSIIVSKLEKAEPCVFEPMSEMAQQIKQTALVTESLERGVRTVENNLNEYAETIQDLKDKVVQKEDLTAESDSLVNKLELSLQMKMVSQVMLKEDVIKKLDKINEETQKASQRCLSQQEVLESLVHKSDEQIALIDQLMKEDDLSRRLDSLSEETRDVSDKSSIQEEKIAEMLNQLNEKSDEQLSVLNNVVLRNDLNDKKDVLARKFLTSKLTEQSEKLEKIVSNTDVIQRLESLKSDVAGVKSEFKTGGSVGDVVKGLKSLKSDVACVKNEFKATGTVREMLYRVERSIIDQLLAEHIITRKWSTLVQPSSQTCYFYVTQMEEFERLGKGQYSRVWFVKAIGVHVKGHVRFMSDGTLDIWLVYGVSSRVVGAKPVTVAKLLDVKVAAVRYGKVNLDLGSETFSADGTTMDVDCDGWDTTCGGRVARIACDKVRNAGYVDVDMDRLLLRFKISVA